MEFSIRGFRGGDIELLVRDFWRRGEVMLLNKESRDLMRFLEDLNRGYGTGMVLIVESGGEPVGAGWVGVSPVSTPTRPRTMVYALGPRSVFGDDEHLRGAVVVEMRKIAHQELFGEPWRPGRWDPDTGP